MSRLFDALQEAARLRKAEDAAGAVIWKELGIDAVPVPEPTLTEPAKKAIAEVASVKEMAVEGVSRGLESSPARAPVLEIDPAPQPSSTATATPATILLDKKARLIPHATDSFILERYRMLRTRILQEQERKPFRSLVVTSASPQEGKTVTALNLALSFASLPSFKILVVDGDVRKGTLGDWLGIDPSRAGLSNLMEGSAGLDEVLLTANEPSLSVIPRGNAQVSDLKPDQFGTVFRQLSRQFDLILVDSPPVNVITDVQIIARSCDAVMLVARAFSTTTRGLEEAVEKLQPFRLIGTVLNAGTSQSQKYHGYYYGKTNGKS